MSAPEYVPDFLDDKGDPSLSCAEANPFHEVSADSAESDDQSRSPFVGLTHDEALVTELPGERYLIDGLIPAGAVGAIAGVPETHKSFLAQAIATRCAAGKGQVLGFDIAKRTSVGYFWQDDSSREELGRIHLFETVHKSPPGLPLRWFLNPGVQLPRDLKRLLATVEEHNLELVVLDSFYNVVQSEINLRESGAELIISELKRELADATGCTALIVDHMPWANDTNRQRMRSYGGVFKNAATRFGIYIDANGSSLSIEVRGNNIRGFKKRAAYWDADTLELRLVDAPSEEDNADTDALEWIVAYVQEHHEHVGTGLAKGKAETAYHEAHGNHGRNLARRVIEREIEAWTTHISGENSGEHPPTLATGPGEAQNGIYLYPFAYAPSPLAAPPSGEGGERSSQASKETRSPTSPPPYKGERNGEQGSSPANEDLEHVTAASK